MFIADMIAPCGLDCSICKRALAEIGPCAGCRGPNDNKLELWELFPISLVANDDRRKDNRSL